MTFDVAIAGAGIVGSSIAWRLAQRGLRVALLDAGKVGGEASSAGAGMLAPGGEIEDRSPWSDFALASLRLYPAFVAELESETGQGIDFQRLGAVEVALTGDEWLDLQTRSRAQSALGIPSCVVSPEDIRKRIPLVCPEIAGGLYYPEDALVNPREVMSALHRVCLQQGVTIREGLPVQKMVATSRFVRIFTTTGTMDVGAAVLAAGAWSSLIPVEGAPLPRSYPVRGHLLGFALEPDSLGPILRRGHTYVLQRAGGFTIAGTSAEDAGFDRTLDARIATDIHSRASELLPRLRGLALAEQWLGFRPAVEGGSPVIRAAGDTALWMAYGHYRNGILLAPATAAKVTAEITANSGTDWFGQSGMH